MTVLLQWLVEHAWIFYAACAVGVLFYLVRALMAQRQRNLAVFTLERETAASQVIRAWVMVLIFVAIGLIIFFSTAFVLPDLPIYNAGTPIPTATLAAGVETPTPGITPTPSPTIGLLVSTMTPPGTTAGATTTPPAETTETPVPESTETPAPTPTEALEAAVSGEVNARFGDFAQLVGFSLPATEVTAGEPLVLTLQWRAMEGSSPVSYLVFTHLLSADGNLIAQHDGSPAGGTRPMVDWSSGETIVDPHPMAFQNTGYAGPGRIEVGLYDPATGRVQTGAGNDRVVLPVAINVVPP